MAAPPPFARKRKMAAPPPSAIQRITDPDDLEAFKQDPPQSRPNLPAPIQTVDTHDGYVSFFFLFLFFVLKTFVIFF